VTLRIRTARVSYRGPDRLDVTRKSGCHLGRAFAPSWKLLGPFLAERRAGIALTDERWAEYVAGYTAEMRASYRANPERWRDLIRRERATLVCYCTDPNRCHRRVLAGLLVSIGAIDEGEVNEHGAATTASKD
jgi:uncharacterized protein YeaO (DUF488 family)